MSGAENERGLPDRYGQGDRDAFALIYRGNSPLVHRFALHITGDRSKAAEVTQDVFAWLIRNSDHFDPARHNPSPSASERTDQMLTTALPPVAALFRTCYYLFVPRLALWEACAPAVDRRRRLNHEEIWQENQAKNIRLRLSN